MPVSKSSNSRRRTMTIRLTSLILSANSSGRISTRPASESTLQTCCASVSLSDRLIAPNLVLFTRPETPTPGQFVIALHLAPCLLEPEVCVCQILVQLRPKRLVPFARIYPGPGHQKKPLLTLLSLIVTDLINFAPYLRLGTARNPVLRYHSSVLKNEISPDQTPTYFFENSCFGPGGRFEGNDLACFRGPLRFTA